MEQQKRKFNNQYNTSQASRLIKALKNVEGIEYSLAYDPVKVRTLVYKREFDSAYVDLKEGFELSQDQIDQITESLPTVQFDYRYANKDLGMGIRIWDSKWCKDTERAYYLKKAKRYRRKS